MNTVSDNRQMQALTGLDLAAFCALAEPFAVGCQQEADARFTDQRPRKRKACGEHKALITILKQKLLFILHYLKTYPTFDLLRCKACEHAQRLAKALARTLRTQGILPARAIESLAQLQQVFADVTVLLLAATERPQHRPQALVDRAADYCGKKKIDP